ncbi:MAG: hypothetical protein RBU30_23680 [Polyangia bacterium]|jgi:hypothetical protein|nr:hypothetical protein [Polyangia bacterium]
MATTISELELITDGLSFEDRLRLLEHLARGLRSSEGDRGPGRLWGIWKDRVPEDLDLDAALLEIRSRLRLDQLP